MISQQPSPSFSKVSRKDGIVDSSSVTAMNATVSMATLVVVAVVVVVVVVVVVTTPSATSLITVG